MRPGVSRCFRGGPRFSEDSEVSAGRSNDQKTDKLFATCCYYDGGIWISTFSSVAFCCILFLCDNGAIDRHMFGSGGDSITVKGTTNLQGRQHAQNLGCFRLFWVGLGQAMLPKQRQAYWLLGCRSNNGAMRLDRICWQTMVHGFW